MLTKFISDCSRLTAARLLEWQIQRNVCDTVHIAQVAQQGHSTCPKGHLSKTYRHRVKVRVRVGVRFSVKFRNLHNSILDK